MSIASPQSNMAESSRTEKQHRDDVFKIFHENYNDTDMGILCEAYRSFSKINAVALKACTLKNANCLDSVNFTGASVSVEEHLDKWYPIGMVFLTGLRIIRNFLQDEVIPEQPRQRDILASLLTYLLDKEITAALCNATVYKTETKLMMLVLNHLLLRVTPRTKCSLDACALWEFSCPDDCKFEMSKLNMRTADTSIGHHEVWHGRMNALVGTPKAIDLAISVVDTEDEDEEESSYSQGLPSSIEVEQEFDNADKPHPQIISQTIVFSLLQKKMNASGNSLIPTIGISGSELVVYFYDYEKDVLLQGHGISFKKEGVSQIRAILVAWLVVNYKYLCDGLVESLNNAPKANFFALCKDKEEIYKNKIRHGAVGQGEKDTMDVFKYAYACSTYQTPQCLAELKDIIPKKKRKV